MINFSKKEEKILLQYTPERQENWIEDAITKRPSVTLKKTFTLWRELFLKENNIEAEDTGIYPDFDEYITSSFVFAVLQGEYYKVIRGILSDKIDIYFYHDIFLAENYFVADSNVSVFKVIEKIYNKDIYIGGSTPNAIAFEEFRNLLRYYPHNYERKKYVEGRISSVLRNYLDNVKDAESNYHKYLDKKLSAKGLNLTKIFQEYELMKTQTILEKVRTMLRNEQEYSENQWQQEILQIILLLYPKYLYVFKEVPVIARLASGIKEKAIDFLLIDGNGNVDIIEIKKPFENAIMTSGLYRDNYIPLRELSGTVMQIEKYIYYLNRWSEEGERTLTNKYKKELPEGFEIKITNPGGIIIMGREVNLTPEQKRDFEVVKRKYKNIVDIITYDSLIDRLEAAIVQAKRI